MRGGGEADFFAMHARQCHAVGQDLAAHEFMRGGDGAEQLARQQPRWLARGRGDAVQDDVVDAVIGEPRIHRCLVRDTAVRAEASIEFHGRKQHRHAAAHRHRASERSLRGKQRLVLQKIAHRDHEARLGERFDATLADERLKVADGTGGIKKAWMQAAKHFHELMPDPARAAGKGEVKTRADHGPADHFCFQPSGIQTRSDRPSG